MFHRDIRLFCRSLFSAVLLGALLLLGCLGTVLAITKSETGVAATLRVAVANEDPDSNLGEMVLELVASHKTVAALAQINFYEDAAEAIHAVESGAAAALVIPEHFFSSIMSGEDLPCRLVLSDANVSGRNTVSTYASVGSDLLTAAQYAVYAGQRYLTEQGAPRNTISQFTLYLNTAGLSQVSNALDTYFETVPIPYTSGGLGMEAHYAVLYLAFFLGVLSLCFSGFYLADCTRPRLSRLTASGVSMPAFLRWKLLLPGAAAGLIVLLLLLTGVRFLPVTLSPQTVFLGLVGVWCSTAFGCLMTLGLGRFSGAFQFVLLLLGLFLSGGILPYSRLHPAVLEAGLYTPLGAVYGLLAPLLGGAFSPRALALGVIYALLGACLTRRRLAALLLGREDL